ncbi:DUF5123 domain-containing protein [Bacteroides sp. 214]|uniref:pectinesterase family protein n=1 Tax=Bacteroides sp. 214 TaxID=2302935 RepID=UPI0013D38973|nr:pectinesterase family protein [Bacteroides sp. 214]NDW13766.1 DUF5123 domain-containing protein [Bacteroides sp. 214]
MRTFFIISLLFFAIGLRAAETEVTPSTFSSAYSAAADGDVLLLQEGNYGLNIDLKLDAKITLRGVEEDISKVKLSGKFNALAAGKTSKGLVLENLTIQPNASPFIEIKGTCDEVTFKNCDISLLTRHLISISGSNGSYDGILTNLTIDKTIINCAGPTGYSLVYGNYGYVLNSIVKESTVYNYPAENFLWWRSYMASPDFSVEFTNNTFYGISKASYYLCYVNGNSGAGSSFTFTNNLYVKGYADNANISVFRSNGDNGTLIANNNLHEGYKTPLYTGIVTNATINDLILGEGALESVSTVPFPDPSNGDFTLLASSALATAGKNGACLGDPRWIKTVSKPANLKTGVYPAGAGSVTPPQATYEVGASATVSASHNFGYRFKEWQDGNGNILSSENPYTFTISEDITLTAIFDVFTTYSLTVNKEGDGATWGSVLLSPAPVNGYYEEGEIVSVTIDPNPVTSFMYWEDETNQLSRQIVMNSEQTITATFDVIPFIVGWNFNNPGVVRGNRPGDFAATTDNTGLMKLYNADGSSTNWGGSTKTFGGVTYDCARRYTDYAQMSTPRYLQAEFSAKDQELFTYENIRIVSYIAADNACVHKIQKIQYATNEAGPFVDLATVDLTDSHSTEWVELSATLPATLTAAEKAKLYIRWIADSSSELLGTPAANDTEGFYLANVMIYADWVDNEDAIAPKLLATTPAQGSSTASANGSIVLTFDERVKAGINEGKLEFNGETLTPVFGNRTVSYTYKNLAYGTPYSYTIPAGLFTDNWGNAFEGATVSFSTMERPQPIARKYDAVVATDGSGDYTTLQSAIDGAPTGRTSPWLVFVKKGDYKGTIVIPANKPFIYLIGQSKEETIIHEKINVQSTPNPEASWYANDLAAWPYSVHNPESPMYGKEGTVVRVNSNDFYAENITFVNDWGVDAQNGPQALAMMTKGDRASFYNCAFRSFQDTWQTAGDTGYRHYAKDCYIEGAVDYIYGAGDCYFDNCTLYCVRGGSVITAPNHKNGTQWGYVFETCTIDGNAASNDGKTKLGRPWHEFPMVAYLNTTMKISIAPEGWTEMGGFPKVFAEYNSMDADGKPIDLSNRKTIYAGDDSPGTTKEAKAVLTAEEAAAYTYTAVTEGTDNWNPRKFFEQVAKPTNVQLEEGKLTWNSVEYAICYIITCNNEVIGFTTTTEFVIENVDTNKTYQVMAANEYGSISEASGIGDPVSIKEEQATPTPAVFITETEVTVSHVAIGATIRLYAIDGQLIKHIIAKDDTVRIPRMSMKGIYVLVVGERAIKLTL